MPQESRSCASRALLQVGGDRPGVPFCMALGAGACAAVRVTPLLVWPAAQVELAAARCVAEGDAGGVGSGQQVDGGCGDVGAQAGGLIGPGDRLVEVLSGLG